MNILRSFGRVIMYCQDCEFFTPQQSISVMRLISPMGGERPAEISEYEPYSAIRSVLVTFLAIGFLRGVGGFILASTNMIIISQRNYIPLKVTYILAQEIPYLRESLWYVLTFVSNVMGPLVIFYFLARRLDVKRHIKALSLSLMLGGAIGEAVGLLAGFLLYFPSRLLGYVVEEANSYVYYYLSAFSLVHYAILSFAVGLSGLALGKFISDKSGPNQLDLDSARALIG